ncbi:MAG: CRISPR-associated endonuclease Cas3'' [Acidiphilium sp.]|nr:CRISPR-associated endonuclease Cas3'' [Acidiphilium sp.]MDD4936747.1 CRISPR-associated endonuclease Cas3'' [Acidiphilium sp.]
MQQDSDNTLRFAHSLPGVPDETKWEPLDGHLRAVAARAGTFAAAFGLKKWGEAAGLLHDIGKNSDAFQIYIRGQSASPDHSTAGAVEARKSYGPQAGRILAFTIAGHHAGLADGKGLTLRLAKQIESYNHWENYTGSPPTIADLAQSKMPAKHLDYPGFHSAFLTRMIFSCLVDADFLETERFYATSKGEIVSRGNYRSMIGLRDQLHAHMAKKALSADATPLNRLRGEILAHAISRATCVPGMFTMTVPTGGGKTLASLSFALEHAVLKAKDRVIYVAPYTSIIEQTAQVFRDALNTDEDILEHHGNFDWDAADDKAGEWDGDGLKKLRRATENWDAPVIVTTAVQFFESLFAARTSPCRKLHNIANSVIVLDEAQILPLHLLRPCMAALDELARNYGTSVVLCTATQPALRVIDNALPLNRRKQKQGFDIGHERELAPATERLYLALKRVNVEVLKEPADDSVIAVRFAEQVQMLCIVNTRGHAKALFDLIKDLPGARHLTTLMCPAHRRKVLAQVRQDLKDGHPVRLVATSLIEAGVDVDFPEVWRAETGLDSVAQAAGRCNREGKTTVGRMVVFTPAAHKLPRAFTASRDSARLPLQMPDPLGLEAIEAYFQALYFNRGYDALDAVKIDDRVGIIPAIERTAPALDFPFASIAAGFRMIDETMRPVIVPWAEQRDEVDRLLAALRGSEVPPARIVRKLQQYTVPVPEAAWKRLLGTGGIQPVNSAFGDRFMVLSSEGLYDDKTGLRLDDPTARSAEENVF